MKVNDIINGFRVIRRREVAELKGVLWELTHEKTGAQLVWLDNGEENKLFSIAFKTLPWDDTGVFHIMEHSVLCGSEHFPVKEPFLDLLKGSMNTFLNAMTYPDKTVYPVSSRNEQDFMNLTEVYLDAVFCPAVYTNPNIFLQEGWHYELRDTDAEPIYKGVVFNEMKGAFADIDSLADYHLTRLIFPDSPYGFESGGDPEKIPDLTYERFLDAHREFYNPENARIYLDGSVPFEKVTKLMDEKYLGLREKTGKTHVIPEQAAVKAADTVEYYAADEDEDLENKAHVVIGKILCPRADRVKVASAKFLAAYLADSNEAPLKKAVLASGLAQDIEFEIVDEVFQPYVFLRAKNTRADAAAGLRKVIGDTAKELSAAGIDRGELEASLNKFEYSLRDLDEPKGLERNLNALAVWLYGGDPLDGIVFDALLREMRANLETDYYEKLLCEILADGEHLCSVTLLPSVTKAAEDEALEKERLAKAFSGWSEEEKKRLSDQNRALDEWQAKPDTKEASATLPKLDIRDISADPVVTPTQVMYLDGIKVLYHKADTNGIVHVTAYFDVNDAERSELPALSFVTELFGELPTSVYSARELQTEIKKYIGHLEFDMNTYAVPGHPENCRVKLSAGFSALESNLEKAAALTAHILRETQFSDRAKIKDILCQTEDDVYQSMLTRGNMFAMRRAGASSNASLAAKELTHGIGFYRYITGFHRGFDEKAAEFSAFAEKISAEIFTKSRLCISVTSSEYADVSAFAGALPEGAASGSEFSSVHCSGIQTRETVVIPSGVSYAASVCNISPYGERYSGKLDVLGNILSFSYLWNEIRVKGGAYGCGFKAGFSGAVLFYSYRDPDPVNSLKVFKDTSEFIKEFVASDEELDKFIISTVAYDEPLNRAARMGKDADADYFTGESYEDKAKVRRELLSLKKEDLLELVPLFEKLAQSSSLCVVGGESSLAQLKDGFDPCPLV